MKLIAVRGENLASLKDKFEIDFTQSPLTDTGLYAITGSTGAGKSTILDAVCLALFNNTPRTNHSGEAQSIPDVGKDSVNTKDSRSILRRGATGGYAEVDFMTISGVKYRAKWAVRRSRDRADGNLQNVTMSLINLSENTHEQGTKTELLTKISELIGLTYEQFTRSVLLAQGDFATFLKAKDTEKAELLEKITGTEIYSTISNRIYEKTKEVETGIKSLIDKRDEIQLLTEDEVKENEARLKDLFLKTKENRLKLDSINNKIRWIEQYLKLSDDVKRGKELLGNAKNSLETAHPRIQLLEQIALAEEVRDEFLTWEKSKIVLDNTENKLIDIQKFLVQLEEEKHTPLAIIQKLETEKDECEKSYANIREEITQAANLDGVIKGLQEREIELHNEIKVIKAELLNVENRVKKSQKTIEEQSEILAETDKWLAKYKTTEPILSDLNLICSRLDELQSAVLEQQSAKEKIEKSQKEIENIKNQLSEIEKEKSELEKQLPAEIMLLREQLLENQPCPVCGSVHHPLANNIVADSVGEKELKERKAKVSTKLEQLNLQLQTLLRELASLETKQETAEKQQKALEEYLVPILDVIPNWQVTFQTKDKLQNQLKNLSQQWSEKSNRRTEIESELKVLQVERRGQEENLKSQKTLLQEKTATSANYLQRLSEEKKRRIGLLGGKTVEETEAKYNQDIARYESEIKKTRTTIDTLTVKISNTQGQENQLIKQCETLQTEVNLAEDRLQDWFVQKKISRETVRELVHKDKLWIDAEQKAIQELRDKVRDSENVLREREIKLTEHQKYKEKLQLQDDESIEQLKIELRKTDEILIADTEESAKIKTVFDLYVENRKKREKLQIQIDKEGENYESWSKLNTLLGSKDGSKFKKIAQSYTLDALLVYANYQLQNLTGRYQLERLSDSLGLQIIDTEMLSEKRSVHSLSGGETFLVALALALALSSISSQNIRIETMFIDEGFGSLDKDTLSVAIDALENLQSQGRKIGVITHVADMIERIPVQVKVEKISGGKSTVSVVG